MGRSRELAELATVFDAGGSLGFRNRIINGDMRIDQRNAGASVSAGIAYPVDRFYVSSIATNFTAQRSTIAPTGFTNSCGITVSSAATPSAGDYRQLIQAIEGFNVADFNLGTASAITFTLSFWVRSSVTGTFSAGLNNNAANRSYVFTYTINAANTWEYKTVTIAGDTTGTWLTDNSKGLELRMDLGSGSTFTTTAGSWQAGIFFKSTGSVNLSATNGATFYITGVQLEAGSVATPFERRDYGRELIMCQRYFEKSYNITVAPGTPGSEGMLTLPSADQSTSQFVATTNAFKVEKRASATMSVWDVVGNSLRTSLYTTGGLTRQDNNNNINTVTAGTSSFFCFVSCAAGNFPTFHWAASAEL